VVSTLEKRLEEGNNPLIGPALMVRWQRSGKKTTIKKEENKEENPLFVKGKIKCKCNKCGNLGHRSYECKSRNQEQPRSIPNPYDWKLVVNNRNNSRQQHKHRISS
jgi:hypothetical protein